jgi:uncharacterized protein
MKDALVFDVRNIQDGVFNAHELDIPVSHFDFELEEVEFTSSVRGNIELLRHGEADVYVKSEVFTDIEMQCGKCLELFITEITANFEVQFTPSNNPDQIESEYIEEGERYYEGETLDISEDTRKALILQIPIWPLCSHKCEGLCYQCGVNLNAEKCTCDVEDAYEVESSDYTSPFAELTQLLEAAKLESESK